MGVRDEKKRPWRHGGHRRSKRKGVEYLSHQRTVGHKQEGVGTGFDPVVVVAQTHARGLPVSHQQSSAVGGLGLHVLIVGEQVGHEPRIVGCEVDSLAAAWDHDGPGIGRGTRGQNEAALGVDPHRVAGQRAAQSCLVAPQGLLVGLAVYGHGEHYAFEQARLAVAQTVIAPIGLAGQAQPVVGQADQHVFALRETRNVQGPGQLQVTHKQTPHGQQQNGCQQHGACQFAELFHRVCMGGRRMAGSREGDRLTGCPTPA